MLLLHNNRDFDRTVGAIRNKTCLDVEADETLQLDQDEIILVEGNSGSGLHGSTSCRR